MARMASRWGPAPRPNPACCRGRLATCWTPAWKSCVSSTVPTLFENGSRNPEPGSGRVAPTARRCSASRPHRSRRAGSTSRRSGRIGRRWIRALVLVPSVALLDGHGRAVGRDDVAVGSVEVAPLPVRCPGLAVEGLGVDDLEEVELDEHAGSDAIKASAAWRSCRFMPSPRFTTPSPGRSSRPSPMARPGLRGLVGQADEQRDQHPVGMATSHRRRRTARQRPVSGRSLVTPPKDDERLDADQRRQAGGEER